MTLHRDLDQCVGMIHRDSGHPGAEAIVYLPGVHGDWTPMHRARPLLERRFRLIEVAYPRAPAWTLGDFARALQDLLDSLQLGPVHLIGESFGSLVGWAFGLACPTRVKSFTLVGGFCQPPGVPKVWLAKWGLQLVPTSAFENGMDLYLSLRGDRNGAPSAPGLSRLPYPAVRTRRGRLATAQRMALIGSTDVRGQLDRIRFPVHYIGGGSDSVVPVRREVRTLVNRLHRQCDLRTHLIPRAHHMILATHPQETTDYIIECTSGIGAESETSRLRADA